MQNESSQKPSGTNPLIWVLVALAALVLVLGGGILYMLTLRPSSPPATIPETTATSLSSPTLPSPTETPIPATQTPTITSAPPTPTPITGDPAVVLGRPSGLDTFDTANNWTLYDNECYSSNISGGMFIMTAKGMPQVSCWEVSWPVIQNYYAETLVKMPATCQPDDRFGLFFRTPDNMSGYLLGLSCDGRYSMTAWDGQTTTVLVEPTANAAILTGSGQSNRLGVLAAGGAYALYANGTLLQVLQDYSFTEAGRLGYFVRAATETGFSAQYDSLAVWLLEPLTPGSTSGQLASVIATSIASTPGLVGTTVPTSAPPTALTPQPTYPPANTPTLTPVYTSDLIGSTWALYKIPDADGKTVSVEDPDKYTLRFNADGSVNVKSDCNTGVGNYRLKSDNRVTIDLTGGTTKDCGEGSISLLFFERLESASNYAIDGDEMSLALTSGGSLSFAR